jgi:2-polyprenyl-3-methyl-5-hydroxy-6-metoxy-1,4-benzoquinol methylase
MVDPSSKEYGADYAYFRARLAKQGPLSYEWWASRFTARLVRRYQRGGRLLEIGCGLGRTLQLLEDDFETHGIDISAYAVEMARQAASRSQIAQMDARDLATLDTIPFKEAFFDVVLAAHVFEHLDNPGETVAHCARLLKPGGLLLFLVPNTGCVSRRWKGKDWFGFRDAGHISLLSPERWLELVRASGLRVADVFGDALWDAPYLPLIPTSIQRVVFLLPALVQFQLGLPLIPPKWGEDLGIVARK